MASRPQRWRGPRRPDVQELRAQQAEDGSSSAPQAAAAPIASPIANPGVSHFKFSFLSAGFVAEEQKEALRVNRRPGIMDATRSFEPAGAGPPETREAKQARLLEQAQRERYAGGLGYGTAHPLHFQHLSRELPPREVAPYLNERPCAFPTVPLPPLDVRPARGLEALPLEEQLEYQRPLRTVTAAGMGFGSRSGVPHGAYVANTYWRKSP